MREVVITRYGAPDVMRVRQAPDPVPGQGEIRIAVQASGVNFADILIRLGLYPNPPPLPCVVGYEVAGTVDAIGPGVERLHEGDRVIALTRFGGYADTVVVPAAHAFPTPVSLSDAEAGAIPVNFLTAYTALFRLANLAEGETVLIHGAGGGVGIAATQLARLKGATVIATASRPKHDTVRTFGAANVIDPYTSSVTDKVHGLTGGRGVDVVLDPIGGSSFRDSYRLLAPLGRLVIYGVSQAVAGERRNPLRMIRTFLRMPWFRPLTLINENRGVLGLNLGQLWGELRTMRVAMETILDDVSTGRLRPLIARTFPLDRADEAHRFIQSRANIGKVMLTHPEG
jgi:NADPH:quinone reductase-like Zn-dependent oxidoreductase